MVQTECPTGLLTEENFHRIYSSFFPLADESFSGRRFHKKTFHIVRLIFVSLCLLSCCAVGLIAPIISPTGATQNIPPCGIFQFEKFKAL